MGYCCVCRYRHSHLIMVDCLKSFFRRLAEIRRAQGWTQHALACASGVHVNQVRRYEQGTAQPTLEGLVKLAKTLRVSLDELVFEPQERGPAESMRLLFEAIERLSEEERFVIREVLEGMIVRYETRRWCRDS